MNHNRNKIDECTDDGCPDVTPEQLLKEEATPDDCRAVERAMGRFNSTTGFLNAIAQVLKDLESGPEAELVNKLLPTMAQVEARSMNGTIEESVPAQNPVESDANIKARFSIN